MLRQLHSEIFVTKSVFTAQATTKLRPLSVEGVGESYLLFAQGTAILQMPFHPTPNNPGQQTLALPGKSSPEKRYQH